MQKKIAVLIFVVAVSMVSFLLATYVESAKITDFIVQQREKIEQDPHKLLLATAIANRHDGSDAFILKEPLVDVQVQSSQIDAQIQVYALAMFDDTSYGNAMGIFINDLDVRDELSVFDDQDNHLLYADIGFNQTIRLGEEDTTSSVETFITLYTNEQKLIIIELDGLLDNYPTLAFESLSLSYGIQNGLRTTFYTLNEDDLNAIPLNSFLIYNNYDRNYSNDQRIVYDETLLPALLALNSYYISHFAVYITIVGILTYTLFFRDKKPNITS